MLFDHLFAINFFQLFIFVVGACLDIFLDLSLLAIFDLFEQLLAVISISNFFNLVCNAKLGFQLISDCEFVLIQIKRFVAFVEIFGMND